MGLPKIGVEAVVDNLDGYQRGIKSVADATDKAGDSVAKTANRFESLGKGTDHLGNIFDIAFGNIIAGAVGKAFDAVSSAVGGMINLVGNLAKGVFDSTIAFSQTMANISAVTGETGKGLKVLNDQILAVGADSAAGPQAVADAYYDVASGVLDASQRLDTLKAAVAASEAGQANLSATTNFLISEMNAYGEAAGGATKVSDVLTATVNKGVGRMDEFVAALTPLAGIAAAQKISLTDLGGAISYMTAKGVPAEQAATQLKAAITLLARETPQTTRALRAMGEKSISASIATHGLGGTLELLQQGAKKTHQNLATLTGSVEALQAITVLGTDDFAKYFDTFVEGVDGATAAARELQRADVSYQLKLIGSRFQAVGIMVGEAVLPAFNKFLSFLNTELANFDWKKIGAGLDKLGEKLGVAVGKIIDQLGAFLTNVDWEQVGTDISNALEGIGNFVANIDFAGIAKGAGDAAKTIGDIANVVGQLGISGTAAAVGVGLFGIALGKALVGSAISGIASAVSGLAGSMIAAAGGAIAAALPFILLAGAVALLVAAITNFQSIVDVFATGGALGGFGDAIRTGVNDVVTGAAGKVGELIKTLKDLQEALGMGKENKQSPVAGSGGQAAGTNAKTTGFGAMSNAMTGVGTTGVQIPGKNEPNLEVPVSLKPPTPDEFTKAVVEPALAGVEGAKPAFQGAGAGAANALAAGVKAGNPQALTAFKQGIQDGSDWIRGPGAGLATSAGAAVIAGLIGGINSNAAGVEAALSGIVSAAIARIKAELGIASPSKVFAGIGGNMMAGWQKGITASAGLPIMAAATVSQNVIAAGGGGSYADNSSRTNIYNLGLQPYQASGNNNTLQTLRG